jgi:TP901 family phage tail tape measure protein
MADTFTKIIAVRSEVNIESLKVGVEEAQRRLDTLGITGAKVTKALDPTFRVVEKGGVILRQSSQIIETTAGKFKLVTQEAPPAVKSIGDFEKALRRVALVVPVWMLARATIQLVTSTISEGIQQWTSFDAQLMKSKAVIHGFAGDSSIAVDILRERINNFSKESGIAVDKLTSAFYRFGTIGVKFEDAMEGAIASAKLAKATFGDIDIIARSLAMTYLLLGKTMDATLTPAEKMTRMATMVYKLWQKNAFEANEFASSLQNFISVANIANFTIDETLALLASLGTAGVMGARGGTLLRTSIFQLVQNLEELAPALGVGVAEGERLYVTFRRVIDSLAEMSKAGITPPETLEAMHKIFGGVRGGQVVSALVALNKELKENEKITEEVTKANEELDKRYQEVINSLSGTAERITNLKKHIGETFVRAIAGGDTFEESLRRIADTIENNVIPAVEEFGKAWGIAYGIVLPVHKATADLEEYAGKMNEIKKLQEGLGIISLKIKSEKLSPKEIEDLQKQIREIVYRLKIKLGDLGLDTEQPVNIYKILLNILGIKEELAKKAEEEGKKEAGITEEVQKQSIYREKIYELQKDLTGYEKELRYIQLTTSGVSDLVVAQTKAKDKVKELVEAYNKLKIPLGEKIVPIDIEDTLKLLRGAITGVTPAEEIQKYFKFYPDVKGIEQFKEALKAINDLLKEESDMTETLLKHELDMLTVRGASSRQLLEAEMALRGISLNANKSLENKKWELSMDKAITAEKLKQADLGGDIVNLYKIAQKYGLDTALEISKIMKGEAYLPEGGTYWGNLGRIIEEYFGKGTREQLKARRWFDEQLGVSELKITPDINTSVIIDQILIDLKSNLDSEETKKRIKEIVTKEIQKQTPAIAKEVFENE